MPDSPLVSVVVVNWNGQAVIAGCLASLAAQTFNDFEVIAVDNGSTDGSLELLYASPLPVRGIRNTENKGFCGANNQGIDSARGKFIALLNNDAEADPGWLAALVDAIGQGGGKVYGMAASKKDLSRWRAKRVGQVSRG